MAGLISSVGVVSAAVGTASADVSPIPVPTTSGPIAVTADSYPFNSVVANRTPRDLAADGYVEREYLVGGAANIYDWPAGADITAIASGPYTTRIVVRRPADPAAFSGHVVVEMLNPTSLHDLDIVWAASQDQFVHNGDVWVGVTVKPSSIAALKTFDASRYAALSMANPVASRCTRTTWSGATQATENGLVWDMVSQIGALLKSNAAGDPLADLSERDLYLTAFSQTSGYATTYINAIAPHAVEGDGTPIYDGYMVLSGAALTVPINQCVAAPTRGSARWSVQPPGNAPVIAVQSLSDFYALSGFFARRPDSDGPGSNYRLYEVAGAAHVWDEQVDYAPGAAALVKSGFGADWWDPYCTQQLTTFPYEYAIDGAFGNLYRWVDEGVPAPSADRITVSDPALSTATIVRDSFGNAIGGLRTSAIDVPRAAYYGTSTGTGTCGSLWGHEEPFTSAQLQSLYPTCTDYAAKVAASANGLADEGWLTDFDRTRIIAAAVQSCPAATQFSVTLPSTGVAGTPVLAAVTALDSAGTPTPNSAGIVTFSSDDPTASLPPATAIVAGAATVTVTFNTAGDHTLTATDAADPTIVGTSSPIAISDPSPPTVMPTITGGTLGLAGWYVAGPILINWTATDPQSPITSPACPTTSVASDTVGTTISCSATSAGGTATESTQISLDSSPPSIQFTGNAGTYLLRDNVSISCTATDAVSGVASSTCPGVSGPAWSLGAGTHTLDATATDTAGNTTSATATYRVKVLASDLCALTDEFVSGSAAFRSAWPLQRIVLKLTVAVSCATLSAATVTRQPAQKARLLAAYQQTMRNLSPTWLTTAQANTLAVLSSSL